MSARKKAVNTRIDRVRLDLGPTRSYDIRVGAGAIHGLPGWLRHRGSKRAFMISDIRLGEARAAVKTALEAAGWELRDFPVQAGEGLKNIESVYPLYGELLKARADRDSLLLALGGGSVGDAAGFVASTYLRGISWVGLPTTLLAQVDSSVGGKTGINHAAGKNLIGSFHQPELVVCDTDFLATLGPREIVSGLGEVVKHAIAFDASFYARIRRDCDRFLRLDPRVLTDSIVRSIRWKSERVARDELDRKGAREVLNLGHTFGHALESLTGYQVFQHGEAVIWGLRFALALSEVRGHLKPAARMAIDDFLASLPVPPLPQSISAAEFATSMSKDKKVRQGRIHFVLIRGLGKTVSDPNVSTEDLDQAFGLLGTRGAAR